MKVIKRNGNKELFNSSKIKKMLVGATYDIHNASKYIDTIIEKLQLVIYNGITTKEIQDHLITTTRNLIDVDNTTYSLIAGRLLMNSYIKTTSGLSTIDKYKNGVTSGLYDDNLDLNKFYNYLADIEHKDTHNYNYNYTSVVFWINRYLHKDETPLDVFKIISATLAYHLNDISYGQKFYDLLATNKLSLATPFLMNLRVRNGNLSSCFIADTPDNMEGIFNSIKDFALVSKNGGGQGQYIGRLRAKGSMIKNVYNRADSVIPVSTIFNQTAVFANQNGKRAGAITLALPIWHSDILEFLELQTESGDNRRKAFDIFPKLVIDDSYIKAVENDLDYAIVCPHEVKKVLGIDLVNTIDSPQSILQDALTNNKIKVGKIIRARDIFKSLINALLIKGLPTIDFNSNLQKGNPLKDIDTIKCSNLCCESFSITNENYTHVCNLASLVLPNIDDDELEYIVYLSILILDTITTISKYPTEKAKRHANDFRVLGLGAMGLNDYLAIRNIAYDSDKGLIEIDKLFEKISLYSYKASNKLAKDLGSFPLYNKSEYSKGLILNHSLDWFKENSNGLIEKWAELFNNIKIYGLRNAQVNCYAPNSSTSLLMGVTAGVLPTYNKFYYDTSSLGSLPVYPKYIQDKFWYYKEYKHYSMLNINTIVSNIQKWTDSGISYELLFNLNDINITDILYTYLDAYYKDIKTIYYIRWVKGDNISEKDECVSCAG